MTETEPSENNEQAEKSLTLPERLRAEIALAEIELAEHRVRFDEYGSFDDRLAMQRKERKIQSAREELSAYFDKALDDALAKNS